MLRQTKELQDLPIIATNGVLGEGKNFHVDDEAWAIRYRVVEVSSWLSSAKVSISSMGLFA